MPLQNIAQRTRLFVKMSTTFNINRLKCDNIDAFNRSIIPYMCEQCISTTKTKDILSHLLSEIVINPIHLRLVIVTTNMLNHILSGHKVNSKRLFKKKFYIIAI